MGDYFTRSLMMIDYRVQANKLFKRDFGRFFWRILMLDCSTMVSYGHTNMKLLALKILHVTCLEKVYRC